MSNEKKIRDYFKSKGLNDYGIAGLLGNLFCESGFKPNNLQNTYEKKLGYTDDEYTSAVDNGSYTNFVKDSAGYGLAQWTYWSRKQGLLEYAQSTGKSIGDLDMQLDYLHKELTGGYKAVWSVLQTASSVLEASNAVLLKFERPADQSESAQAKRAKYGQGYYDKYADGNTAIENGEMTMTEKQLRQKIVDTAISYLGCNENDGSHKKIIDLYNSHKPLAVGYVVKYTDAWCSTFASAVAIKAGLTDIIPTECGCERHIKLFQKLGSWVENDAYGAEPGDYIFYDWDDNGVGDCTGDADHVGIVTAATDTTLTVIEGNKSNSVEYRTIPINGRYIRGFGVPNYKSKCSEPEQAVPVAVAESKVGGNSPLVSYTKISPNKAIGRGHVIDTITIHCVVGQCSVETLGEVFAPASKRASSNYGVGADGRIGMYVEEKDRSWCTSSSVNDDRAVTIEVASDTFHPYAVRDAAYQGLLNLVTDICQRNGIKKLLWRADESLIGQVDKQNMTAHRWFAAKACPGDYLYNLFSAIAAEVNKRLGAASNNETEDDDMDVNRFQELWLEMRKELKDNDSATWSQEARDWSINSGLIQGGGNGADGQPNYMWEDVLTREQMVTVLYRFAQMMGKA